MNVKNIEISTKDYGKLHAEPLECAFMDISFELNTYDEVQGFCWLTLDKTHLKKRVNYYDALNDLHANELMCFARDFSVMSKKDISVYKKQKKLTIKRMRAFVEGTIKGYKKDIEEGVVTDVTIFYPLIRITQNDVRVELRYFTLIKYFTGERFFRISKIISDDNHIACADDVKKHIRDMFEMITPTFMVNSEIYDYKILDDMENDDGITIMANQIFSLFIKRNFGIICDPEKACCSIAALGEVRPSENKKTSRITKAIYKDMVWIGIKHREKNNYIKHCRMTHTLLPQLETFQRMLYIYVAQTKKKPKHRFSQAKQNVLESYLKHTSKRLNINLNVQIQRMLKSEIDALEIIGMLVEKLSKGSFSALLEHGN